MRKPTYLRFQRILEITKAVLVIVLMILAIISKI